MTTEEIKLKIDTLKAKMNLLKEDNKKGSFMEYIEWLQGNRKQGVDKRRVKIMNLQRSINALKRKL